MRFLSVSVYQWMGQNKFLATLYGLLFIVAATLRFYQLGEPQKPVFDEVYFPKYAYHYVQDKPFYHTHPPLAKYVFEAGMRIYHSVPGLGAEDFGKRDFQDVPPLAIAGSMPYLVCSFALLSPRSVGV